MLTKLPIIPIAELFAKGLAFFIIIIMTRILSVEEYGVLNYVVSLVMLVSVLMDGGINNYIFNKSVKNELEEINDYFNSRIVLSFLIILTLLIFVFFYQKKYFIYVLLYATFVFFNSTLSFFKMLARGREYKKIDLETIALDPFFRLLFLSILFISHIHISLIGILEIFLFVEIFIFLWIYFNVKQYFDLSLSFEKHFSKIKSILTDSKYFLIYYLFFVGMQRIDVLFINHTIDSTAVALFSSAYNLYMVILLFFSSYLTSGFKSIMESKTKLVHYIKEVSLFYLLIASGIFLFSKYIYLILYPAEYAMAHQYLILFMVSLPFTILSYFSMYYFNHIHKTYLNVIILFIFFSIKSIYLFLMQFEDIEMYIAVLIVTEIVLGISYFILLTKYIRGAHIENPTDQ